MSARCAGPSAVALDRRTLEPSFHRTARARGTETLRGVQRKLSLLLFRIAEKGKPLTVRAQ